MKYLLIVIFSLISLTLYSSDSNIDKPMKNQGNNSKTKPENKKLNKKPISFSAKIIKNIKSKKNKLKSRFLKSIKKFSDYGYFLIILSLIVGITLLLIYSGIATWAMVLIILALLAYAVYVTFMVISFFQEFSIPFYQWVILAIFIIGGIIASYLFLSASIAYLITLYLLYVAFVVFALALIAWALRGIGKFFRKLFHFR